MDKEPKALDPPVAEKSTLERHEQAHAATFACLLNCALDSWLSKTWMLQLYSRRYAIKLFIMISASIHRKRETSIFVPLLFHVEFICL